MTAPVFTSASAYASVLGASALTLNAPTFSTGDVLTIACEYAAGSSGAIPTLSGTNAGAFTRIGLTNNIAQTSAGAVWQAVATSGSFALPQIDAMTGADHVGAVVFAVSGADTTAPYDVVASQNYGAVSTSQVGASLGSTTVNDCLVVDIVFKGSDSTAGQLSGWTNASLSSLTEQYDTGTTIGDGGGVGINSGIKATAGSVSQTTLTSVSGRCGAVTIAFKPPSATNGTATLTGAAGTSSAGTLTGKGAANVTPVGAQASAVVGTLAAIGAALATLAGVQGASATGTLSATADGLATLTGAQADASAGTLSAFAGTGAMLSGVSATSAAGTITATGTANVILAGVGMAAEAGDLDASGDALAGPPTQTAWVRAAPRASRDSVSRDVRPSTPHSRRN